MYEEILYEVNDPVATITLNRPEKLNATTARMIGELRHAVTEAERSEEVVGIVITGAGRGFCAGADMAGLQEIQASGKMNLGGPPAEPKETAKVDGAAADDFQRGLTYLLAVRKPILAAVNGPCAGFGFSIAMFCDLRFASDVAFFTTAFAQRGLVAEHGLSWLLPRLLGTARALDILWSGRRFDANEALQLGVVNRVVAADALLAEAQGFVRELAAQCSPRSIANMKEQIYGHLMLPLGAAMRETEALMEKSAKWPDFKEGLASYMEGRPPRFDRLGPAQPEA